LKKIEKEKINRNKDEKEEETKVLEERHLYEM
jgi:hypothetical protein